MNWIINQIEENGDQIAIVFEDKSYTYCQLAEQIKEYHEEIKSKLVRNKHNIVGIVSDYSFESIALFFALHEHKKIIVPITTKTELEISERLKISGCDCSIYINDKDLIISKFENIGEINPLVKDLQNNNHSGLILFSSGSTGTPKAMIHNLDNLIDSYKEKKGKKLTFMIFLMFDHIGGLNTLLNCVSMGVKMVFPSNRDPEHVCSLIEKYSINILPASPTFLNLILISESYKRYDLSSLRLITYGTEPMPENLLLKLKEVFPTIKFLQTFGTSETGISKMSSKSSSSTLIKFDDPDTEFKIIEGELWIRSKTQILGYLNSSMDRFTDDGWFKTGDLVEESEDGFLKIVGRNSEIINVGGEKVFPSEVESILFLIPEIKDCIVYGESNPIIGQIVVAKILFTRQINNSEAKKLITSFCLGKLDKYKIPAKVIIMKDSEYSARFKKKRI